MADGVDDLEVDDVDGDVEAGGEGAESTVDELKAQLAAANASAQRLAELQSDPDVAAVVAAKADNRSLNIRIGGEASEEVVDEEPTAEEIEAMSKADLLALATRRARKDVEAEFSTRLGVLETELQAGRRKELAAQAKALQARYGDVAEHKEAIVKLAETGLNLEEAYLVARLRSGKGIPQPAPKKPTAVESPSGVTVRTVKKATPARPGARGFSSDLRDVLDRVELTS